MSDEFKIETTGTRSSKCITRNGEVVAMAEELTNGRWVADDPNDGKRLTYRTFKTANAVKKWCSEFL